MLYGWTGLDLEIDLALRSSAKTEANPDLLESYLGGRGIGCKMAWDRIPPEVEPFSSRNVLIVSTGVLDGTTCPGANKTVLTTRSPQTNFQTYSLFGGFFGAELKFAGYDNIIISQKADSPVYLLINDDKVELRDARHLWGQDTFATQSLIRKELDDADLQVFCIGPAGENRVIVSSVEHSNGASASRAGIGAVMGDKRLKAVAVRGSEDVKIARPREFGELVNRLLIKSEKQKKWIDDISHNQIAGLVRLASYGNIENELPLLETGDTNAEFLHQYMEKRPGCFNCQFGCKQGVRMPGHGRGYLKCVSHYTYWAAFKIMDFGFNYRCYELVERLGMDSMSVCALAAFAIDLFEKGILTPADTDGLRLEFGNEQVALTLIKQIALREGIGAVLANGIVEAARQIGRGAEEFAYHTKGIELTGAPYQFPYLGFVTALADRPDTTRLLSYVPQHLFMKTPEFKQAYVDSEFWPYPKEWSRYVWDPFDPTGGDWERMSRMLSRDRDEITLTDCMGLCTFWTDFWPYSPIKGHEQAELFSYATGIDLDEEEALRRAARTGALIRAYNCMLGLRRAHDTIPEKFFREPAPPRFPAVDRAKFQKVVDEYHKLRGWNAEGIPTRECLRDLDLEDVGDELSRRGLYAAEAAAVPSNGHES